MENLIELFDTLDMQARAKRDQVYPSANMRMENGEMVLTDGLRIRTCEVNCHAQIAAKLKIPYTYYKRMQSQASPLLDRNVNEWLAQSSASFLVRQFDGEGYDKPVMRALLSDRYHILDNDEVAYASLESISASGEEVKIMSANVTDKRLYIEVNFPNVLHRAPELLSHYRPHGATDDRVMAGIIITNSETGFGRFQVIPRIWILVCKNGQTRRVSAISKTHIGAQLEEGVIYSPKTQKLNHELILSQTSDAVKHFATRDFLIDSIRDFTDKGSKQVGDMVKTVENVGKKFQYSEERKNQLLKNFTRGGDATIFGLSSAMTLEAQSQDSDAKFDAEKWAEEVLYNSKSVIA